MVLVLAVASVQRAVPMELLMRDTVSIVEVPPYVGALSHLGVLLWCSTAAIALFGGSFLWARRGRDRMAEWLVGGGLLSLLLMGDDLFTVHEVIAYYAGLPDSLVIAVYGGVAVAYFAAYRRTAAETDVLLLGVALLLLGTSILVDLINPKDSALLYAVVGDRYHLVEDGPKLLGIAVWLAYYARVCWVEVGRAAPETGPTKSDGDGPDPRSAHTTA